MLHGAIGFLTALAHFLKRRPAVPEEQGRIWVETKAKLARECHVSRLCRTFNSTTLKLWRGVSKQLKMDAECVFFLG